ncbi:hypothetical protein D3C72_2050090 [compost metagenome]
MVTPAEQPSSSRSKSTNGLASPFFANLSTSISGNSTLNELPLFTVQELATTLPLILTATESACVSGDISRPVSPSQSRVLLIMLGISISLGSIR